MALSPACLARLKLRQPPFEALPGEEFLYSDPLLESLVETAIRALVASGAIVILAGADGAGRSIQLMRLLGALGENFELIAFRGLANIPFSAVDVTIRNQLRATGTEEPSRPLAELLIERSRAGAALVLAIDDAHLIGMEIVDRLLRLRAEILEARGQGLRLILVGDATLNRGRLPLPDPADENQVVRLNLRPFNLEQAGAYLRHRLRMAGIEDPDTLLSSGDIAVLQTSSKGLPALLNANATAWLARRCRGADGFATAIAEKPAPRAGEAPVKLARVPAVAAAPDPAATRAATKAATSVPREGILELEERVRPLRDSPLSRFLVSEDAQLPNSDFERVLSQIRNNKLLPEAPPPPPPPEAPSGLPKARVAVNYWNRSWFVPAILATVVVSILVPVVLQLEGYAPERTRTAAPQSNPASALDRAAESGAAPTRKTLDAEAPMRVPPATFVAGPSVAGPEIPPVAEDPSGRQSPAAPQIVANPSVNPPSAPPVGSGSRPEPLPATAPVDAAADRDWLLRQDPKRFTIQLIAARNLTIAKDFVAQHQLEGTHFVQTRSFMVALIGSYPNRAEAEKAARTLPAGVRANDPWIRTIGSVLESR